jgi:ribosomal protein S18 acetylase RimI-like enzyme
MNTGARQAEGIVVRRLGVPDAPRYRALRLESFRQFPHAHRTDYDEAAAQPLAWTENRLCAPGEYWFGAFDGIELVGAVGLRTQEIKKIRHVAKLLALAVDGRRQRQGIGRMLVAHLLDFARSLGHIEQVQLTVNDGNEKAERLYDAFGFEQFGLEREAILQGGEYHAKQHRQLFLGSTDLHE